MRAGPASERDKREIRQDGLGRSDGSFTYYSHAAGSLQRQNAIVLEHHYARCGDLAHDDVVVALNVDMLVSSIISYIVLVCTCTLAGLTGGVKWSILKLSAG